MIHAGRFTDPLTAMKTISIIVIHLLMVPFSPLMAADPVPPLRVLVWDEQQPEQRATYDGKFLGETIAAHLSAQPGLTVTNASLSSPSQGLDEETLDNTDVVIWWSHQKNDVVDDAHVDRLVSRVLRGRLGLVVLHSAHWSKPFVRLMQQRAIDDARALIPAAERAEAVFAYENEAPYGKVPAADAPLTPALRKENGVWKLTLPGCIFPAYRPDGAPSHLTTLAPDHPVAAGLPQQWDVPHTEMYAEPFHVPTPDEVVFEERWDRGEHFRSGCAWQVGAGRVFYFRPGHETYPVFKQNEPLRVVENATRWAAPEKAVEPVTAPPAAIRFDPVLIDLEGWKVHVDPALLDGGAQHKEGAQALQMLANHLQRIKVLVPAGPLARLQTIEIWIEHDHPTLRSMQYHPGREWLVEHGHDPRLTRKVHITQARDLLSREEMLKHPAVILHELAHGYHDQILGFEHPAIIAAYEQAREAGSYANVLLYNGERVSHYALTDHKEYFAEGTEAFFYRNDFYPFVRAELKIHDPSLDTLLESVWGPGSSQ